LLGFLSVFISLVLLLLAPSLPAQLQENLWDYKLPVTPGARCTLTFEAGEDILIQVLSTEGKPLPTRQEKTGNQRFLYVTSPLNHPLGGSLTFRFQMQEGKVSVQNIRFRMQEMDTNRDGVSDAVERMMGIPLGARAWPVPRPPTPYTSFQTGERYSPNIGVPTDAVLIYSSNPEVIQTWADRGYTLQTMGGFRAYEEYVKEHPEETQQDRNNKPITIANDFYMVPTENRTRLLLKYYTDAIQAGSQAICPEEPEYWAKGDYSEAFKAAWQERYATSWEPPHASVDSRYRAEQLKAYLKQRVVRAILQEAARINPEVRRMAAVHSPINYSHWAIISPHYGLLKLPELQEIIGQVWTGTARTPARLGGARSERTFEVGYLEYSSLYHLIRGTDKSLWFLMDPVEDNPNLPMEDYHQNYERTLLAALMFPDVIRFEVMPWPQRIYGRVPNDYAIVINTVVGALADLWRFPRGSFQAGSEGIGTFTSDSMQWQRAEPFPSDMDGFYGLCLPLIEKGIPVRILSLDRAVEPGYLDGMKVLLVSYDFLKPLDRAANEALAAWIRKGGSLIVFGGTDAYNDVRDSWWKKEGFDSPLSHLLMVSGIYPDRTAKPAARSLRSASGDEALSVLLSGAPEERSLQNRKRYTLDLTSFAQENGSVLVRFEDISKEDGWGPYVAGAELRIGNRLAASFQSGSDLETRFLAQDSDSQVVGETRFADRNAFWSYRFDNLPKNATITLTVDMGNGFLVKAGPARIPPVLLTATDETFGKAFSRLRIPPGYPFTFYPLPPKAKPLYTLSSDPEPVVWEGFSGNGRLIYAGVAPGYLSSNTTGEHWMRALVKYAFDSGEEELKESTQFLVRRGPYIGIKTFGDASDLEGHYIDLLKPNLPLLRNPTVPANGLAFLQQVKSLKGAPSILAVSGRLRVKSERVDSTAFLAQGPDQTKGVARIYAGRMKAVGVKAYTRYGTPVSVNMKVEGNSLFVEYPNDPEGVVVRIGWKPPSLLSPRNNTVGQRGRQNAQRNVRKTRASQPRATLRRGKGGSVPTGQKHLKRKQRRKNR
jgi:hypothetical protein